MFDVSNLESIDALESGDLLIVLRKNANGIADILQYDISNITSPDPVTSIWSYGPYAPSPLENPAQNSYYLNTTTGQIYTTITTNGVTTWNKNSIMTLTGPKGENGKPGESAYQIAVDNGYTGTQSQWLASLVGANGADGTRVYFVYSVPTGVISDSRGNCRPGDYAIVSLDGTVTQTSKTSSIGETYVYEGAGAWSGPLTISLATTGPAGPAPKLESSDTLNVTEISDNVYKFSLSENYLNLDASTNVNQVINQGQNIIAFGLKNNDTSEIFMGINLVNEINTLSFVSSGKTSLLIENATGLNVNISPSGSSFDTGTITTNGSGILTASGLNSDSYIGLNSLVSDPILQRSAIYVLGGSSNDLKFYDGSTYHKIILDTDLQLDLENKLQNYAKLDGNNNFTKTNTFKNISCETVTGTYFIGNGNQLKSDIPIHTYGTTVSQNTFSPYLSTSSYYFYNGGLSVVGSNYVPSYSDAGKFLLYQGSDNVTIPKMEITLKVSVYGKNSSTFTFYGFSQGSSVINEKTITLNTGDILILHGLQWIDNNNQGYYYELVRSGLDLSVVYDKTTNLSSDGSSYTGNLDTAQVTDPTTSSVTNVKTALSNLNTTITGDLTGYVKYGVNDVSKNIIFGQSIQSYNTFIGPSQIQLTSGNNNTTITDSSIVCSYGNANFGINSASISLGAANISIDGNLTSISPSNNLHLVFNTIQMNSTSSPPSSLTDIGSQYELRFDDTNGILYRCVTGSTTAGSGKWNSYYSTTDKPLTVSRNTVKDFILESSNDDFILFEFNSGGLTTTVDNTAFSVSSQNITATSTSMKFTVTNAFSVNYYGKNLIEADSNTLSTDLYISSSVADGLTSSGTTITDATSLISITNVITTSTAGSGVKLPSVVNGVDIWVLNRSSNDFKIYPNSTSEQIESLSLGAAQNISPGGSAHFRKTMGTMWRVL